MQILSIGRDANNNIVLNDNFVSRQHAQLILMDNGQVMLKDLSSANGTFINGNKISEYYLKPGDVVKCASVFLNWENYIHPEIPIQNQQYQQVPQPQPQPVYQTNIVNIGNRKSVGLAFLLAFLFGPLGLLYASVTGGIIMFILGIIIGIVTFGMGLILVWPICIIWAVIAANNENSKISSGSNIVNNRNI